MPRQEQTGRRADISACFSFKPTVERIVKRLDPKALQQIENALASGFSPEEVGKFLFDSLEKQVFLERVLGEGFRTKITAFWDSLSAGDQKSFDQNPELHERIRMLVDSSLRVGIQQALTRRTADRELINATGWWLDQNMYPWERFSQGYLDIAFKDYEVLRGDPSARPLEFPDHRWIDGNKILRVIKEVKQTI